MKNYISKIIDKIKYESKIKQGLEIKYKYEKEKQQLSFWEEDAWGRRHRVWVISEIPYWEYEVKGSSGFSPHEIKEMKKKIKKRNVKLNSFMADISYDWYNVRQTWATQRKWTYDQIKEFEHWLEQTRWY